MATVDIREAQTDLSRLRAGIVFGTLAGQIVYDPDHFDDVDDDVSTPFGHP